MAESVRRVADAGIVAPCRALPPSQKQVPNDRLPTDQKLVRLNVPGADVKPPTVKKLLQALAVFRAYRQIVFQHNRLPVEIEMPVVGVRFQQVDQEIHHLDEPPAELLERAIPFAVPVGMRNDMGGIHGGCVSFGM